MPSSTGPTRVAPAAQCRPGETAPACYDLAGDKVVQKVKDAAFGLLGNGVAVSPTWPGTQNARNSEVSVAATYTYNTLVPLVPLPPITITAESTLVINN